MVQITCSLCTNYASCNNHECVAAIGVGNNRTNVPRCIDIGAQTNLGEAAGCSEEISVLLSGSRHDINDIGTQLSLMGDDLDRWNKEYIRSREVDAVMEPDDSSTSDEISTLLTESKEDLNIMGNHLIMMEQDLASCNEEFQQVRFANNGLSCIPVPCVLL